MCRKARDGVWQRRASDEAYLGKDSASSEHDALRAVDGSHVMDDNKLVVGGEVRRVALVLSWAVWPSRLSTGCAYV